jgi:hypothetical protein
VRRAKNHAGVLATWNATIPNGPIVVAPSNDRILSAQSRDAPLSYRDRKKPMTPRSPRSQPPLFAPGDYQWLCVCYLCRRFEQPMQKLSRKVLSTNGTRSHGVQAPPKKSVRESILQLTGIAMLDALSEKGRPDWLSDPRLCQELCFTSLKR